MAIGTEVNVALAFTVASNSALRAIQGIGQSFATLSQQAQAATQSINGVNAAILAGFASNRARNAIQGMAQSFQQLAATLPNTSTMLNNVGQAWRQLDLQMRDVDRTLRYFAAGILLVSTKNLLEHIGALQRTKLEMAVFNQSYESVGETMESVLKVSEKVPFSMKALTDGFVKLKASGIDPITGKNGEGPLLTLANAVAAFGGSTDVFERAILAISQMAGKGVVSMEELRQQLGEAIPTALRSMAAGMDMSVSQLIQQVERGKVSFERGFGALIPELERQFKGVGQLMLTTLPGAFQAVKTQFDKMLLALDKAGAFDSLIAALNVVQKRFSDFATFLDSPAGQDAIKKWSDSVYQFMQRAEAALPAIKNFGAAVIEVFSKIAEFIGTFGPESQAYGLIGYVLFGLKGLAVGLLIGPTFDVLVNNINGAFKVATGGMTDLKSFTSSLFGNDIFTYGALGMLLMGPHGAIAGALAGLFKETMEYGAKLHDIVNNVPQDQRRPLFGTDGMLNDKNKAEPTKAMAAATKELEEANKAAAGSQAALATAVQSARPSFTGLTAEIQAQAATFDTLRKNAAASVESLNNKFGLDQQQLKVVTEVTKAYDSLELKVKGAGNEHQTMIQKAKDAAEKLQPVLEMLQQKYADQETVVARARAEMERANSDINAGVAKTANENWVKQSQTLKQIGAEINTLGKQYSDFYANIEKSDSQYAAKVKEKTDVVIEQNKRATQNIKYDIEEVNAKRLGTIDSGTLEIIKTSQSWDDKLAAVRTEYERIDKIVKENPTETSRLVPILESLKGLEQEIVAAKGTAIDITRRDATLKQQQNAIALEGTVKQEEYNAKILKMKVAFDEVGIAGAQASRDIDNQLKQIDATIVSIQQKQIQGLISPETAAKDIERLQAIRAEIEKTGAIYVQQATFTASKAGQLWTDVANTIQNTLSDGIVGLIEGTKTMKQVMMDFWKSITKAVVDYLVKEAMVKAFGGTGSAGGFGIAKMLGLNDSGMGGSSGGGLLGGLFSGIGKIFGFASGGSFTVGGAGATDSVPVAFMATPGEQVSVTTPGQAARSGGAETYNINITAVDAASVRDLFMREGNSLVNSISQRNRLNRGFRA